MPSRLAGAQSPTNGSQAMPPMSSSSPVGEQRNYETPSVSEEKMNQRAREFEGTVDHLKCLLKQEDEFYMPCLDYLASIASQASKSSSCPLGDIATAGVSRTKNVDRVNEAWRRKLCEWCFEVVDHFGMDREVVSVAMNYLDRVVARTMVANESGGYQMTKRQFQLISVASLYLAVKLHGETEEHHLDRRKLNVDVFVELSRGYFEAETLQGMELNILFNLGWHLNPPTPLKFVASLIRLMPSWSTDEFDLDQASFASVFRAVFDIAMYLTELSVCVSTFTFHSKNSVVAYASILCAMDALSESLPIPYEARVCFLNNAAAATGLLPEAEEVRSVRNLLGELCPAITERDVSSIVNVDDLAVHDDDAGKASPICVSHGVLKDLARNKRSYV